MIRSIGASVFLFFAINAESAPPSVDDVAKAMKSNNDTLFDSSGFRIDYARTDSVDHVPSKYSGGYATRQYAVARTGSDWYTMERNYPPKEDGGTTLPGEKAETEGTGLKELVLKDGLLFNWDADARTGMLEDDVGRSTNMFHAFDYFVHAGLNPFRPLVSDAGLDYEAVSKERGLQDYFGLPILPNFLLGHKRKYRVLPQMDKAGEALCWVIEWKGMDKIWLDPELGLAIRRRVFRWGEDGPRRLDIRNSEFIEAMNGLWLPREQHVLKYANQPSESPKIWDRVAAELKYEVDNIEFGDVSEAMNIRPPEDSVIHDFTRDMVYAVPEEGAAPLDQPILEGFYNSTNTFPWRLVIAAVLFAVCAAWLVVRKIRTGRV